MYGFSALVPVLVDENAFEDECAADDTERPCLAQQQKFTDMISYASSASLLVNIIAGMCWLCCALGYLDTGDKGHAPHAAPTRGPQAPSWTRQACVWP